MSTSSAEPDLFQQLQDYQLPSQYHDHSQQNQHHDGTIDPNLLQQYRTLRDEYLRKSLLNGVLEKVGSSTTFNGETFVVEPPLHSEQDWEALHEQQELVRATITEKATAYQRLLLELRAKHEHFQTRRAELQDLLDGTDYNLDDCSGGEDDDSEQEEIDEEAVSAQQERLSELQKKRAALQVELRLVQERHDQSVQNVAERKAELQALEDKENYIDTQSLLQDPVALQNLKDENHKLRVKVEKLTEINNFYEKLRLLMEELMGVRVLAVDPAGGRDMLMKVQLLQKYNVDIVLRLEAKDTLKVVSAKFVSDNTIITGPATVRNGDNSSINNTVVQLQIPPLDDLVAASTQIPTGDNVRFLLRETKARIEATQQRVHELTLLQTEALTKIGKYSVGQNNDYQEVVCSLNYAQMTAVLRLTPDCPLVEGSVYLDQLVGIGGWETSTVERIKTAVHAEGPFKSPVAILKAIKLEIERLQNEEGLVLPETPRFSARSHEW